MTLRKTLLWAVLASLAIAALLGIQSLLFDISGGRWISTMLGIMLFSLTSLGASIVLERRTWAPAMWAAVAISLTGLVTLIVYIWSYRYHPSLTTFIGVVTTWAISLPAAGLLRMTRFEGILVAYRNGVTLLALVSAACISIAIVAEPRDEFAGRLLGVLLITTFLGAISIPILFRIYGVETRRPVETSPLEIQLTCPRCLLAQTAPSGPSRCARCKLKFTLEIEEPRCPECNYLLYRLTTPRCPECGHALGADDVEASDQPAQT